jgi:exopolyphosphatase/guanosine-5'-triphosphate,3'-diphosphate pyrophosphatase
MPGFSTREQGLLSLMVRAHRGSLKKLLEQQPVKNSDEWMLILVLRLAVLLCRSRSDAELPAMKLKAGSSGFSLTIDRTWLEHNTLTRSLLENEVKDLKSIGIAFSLKTDKAL